MTVTSASEIPPGVAYFDGYADRNQPRYALQPVRVRRGTAELPAKPVSPGVIVRRGETTGYPSASGRQVLITPRRGPLRPTEIVSVPAGTRRPIRQDLWEGYPNLEFQAFSPQEHYLSVAWEARENEAEGGRLHSGIGIYDSRSQQIWKEERAALAAWSVSGRQLVFARYFHEGKYLRVYINKEFDFPPRYAARSPEALLEDMHFFFKDAGRLADPGAQRIGRAQAERMVGKWYTPALLQALRKTQDTTKTGNTVHWGNAVAPGGRGVVLFDRVNKHYDPNRPATWTVPRSTLLEWTTRYIDAQGRSAVYTPTPPLDPVLSWSRDGERVYSLTYNSATHKAPENTLLCVWLRTGRYAQVSLPTKFGDVLTYIED